MATRRRYLDLDVLEKIEVLALQKATPSQIYRHMEKDNRYQGRVPTIRTIQRIVSSKKVTDPSGPWTIEDFAGEDSGLILEVLENQILITEGRVRNFSKAEANLILKIRKIAPGLHVFRVYLLAQYYRIRKENGESTEPLDAYLAFKPWRSEEAWEKYDEAVKKGYVAETIFRDVHVSIDITVDLELVAEMHPEVIRSEEKEREDQQ